VLLAHPALPANDVKGLVALAKAQPGKMSYASSGSGSQQHLAMEVVRVMTGIDLLHVPYKGFGPGVTDVMAGHIPLVFGGITASIGLIRGGKVKGIAVTSPARAKALPDVPSFQEQGLDGFDIQAWYGFVAPAGTPGDIVGKINADLRAIIARSDFQERLAKDGLEPVGNTPSAFAVQIKSDIERWAGIVRRAGLKPE
jgi:tripartite-type tricarboxylate transporter receptor subunit TctC